MSNFTQRFSSPPMRFQGGFQPGNNSQSTPKPHHNTHFQRRSPFPRSPGYNNQHISRNASPYHQMYRDPSKSFNSSASSPDQWNSHSNQSYSSNSSNSYYGDVSGLSPYNSPVRNDNRSPNYSSQNRNRRFQEDYTKGNKRSKIDRWPTADKSRSFNANPNNYWFNKRGTKLNDSKGKQHFQSPGSNNSNPGHSSNIQDYIHPSMLEDPWKDLIAEAGKKKAN